jgi:hypothetical protein
MSQILLRDIAAEFARELQALFLEAGEADLAARVQQLNVTGRCRCGDNFCSTFYTAPPSSRSYGPDHHTIALAPQTGLVNVDVVGGKIVCVEALYRDDLKAQLHAAEP